MENNTYTLTISGLNTENENTSVELSYNGQPSTTTAVEIKKKDKVCFHCKISAFSCTKAIYRPGKLSFTLQLGWPTSVAAPSIDSLYAIFNSGKVQLKSGDFVIADTYFIFNIRLEQRSASTFQRYAHFEAYSPDQYLTLDKYCKAYTGRKLITDILTQQSLWPDAVSLFTDLTTFSGLLESEPQFLTYEVKRKNAQTNQDETLTYEYIQPYLVQYNESFLDFLIRVANRCGEFLYYERGKLHLGWPKASPLVQITNFTSISYTQGVGSAWKADSLSEVHNDYTTNKNRMTVANAKMMRDSEVAFDENLSPLPPKDQYTQWKDYAAWPEAFWINTVSSALNESTLVNIIETLLWKPTTTRLDSANLSNDANNNYKTTNFQAPYLSEQIYKVGSSNSSDSSSASNSSSRQGADMVDDKDGIYPYSSTPTDLSKVTFGLAFYADIQQGIARMERSRIHVVLENYFYPVALGDKICFEQNGPQYIVVKIDHVVKSVVAPHPSDTMTFREVESALSAVAESSSEMLEIEAIPCPASGSVYPPSAQVPTIRVSSAQRAIVTHNADPLKMGRVRVRYPWQQPSDDPTPWIRIAQPMASKDSGFRFLPEKGDEAIVNYENGNIERPYVEGMLFSAERQPSYAYKGSSNRIISSKNGHSIIFSDLSGENFFQSFSPLVGTLSTFAPQFENPIPMGSKAFQKASGGIQLTDTYGFYSISMSSDKRSISIDSPLGKVGINAFTGITISAPNGNVKIVGKNVDIVAGNNLTLRSGTNKGNIVPSSVQQVVNNVASFVASKFTIVDLSVIRTVFETFVRPIAGTLRISSKRYLCVEAGKGSAQIMGRRTVQQFHSWKDVGAMKESSFGSYTIDRNPADKVFTVDIPDVLGSIRAGILRLFKENRKQSVDLMERIERYQNIRQLLEAMDLDAFLKDTHIADYQTIFQDASNHKGPKSLEMKVQIVGKDPIVINRVRTLMGKLNREAQSIYTHWYDEDAKMNGYFPQNSVALTDAVIRQQIHNLMQPVLPSTWISKQGYPNEVRGIQIDLKGFRQVFFSVLTKLVDNQKPEDGNSYLDTISRKGVGSPWSYDRQDWIKFVNNISETSAVVDVLKTVGKGLFNAGSLEGMMDQYVWDQTDHGKILFSDEGGRTLHIDQGTLQTYMESRNRVDDIGHTIAEIKRVLHLLD